MNKSLFKLSLASIFNRGLIPLISLGLVLGACSSSKGRVLRTDDGNLATLGTGKDVGGAWIAAIDSANSFCSRENKDNMPVFPKDATHLDSDAHPRELDFGKILPMLNKVFKTEDSTHVMLSFKCLPGHSG